MSRTVQNFDLASGVKIPWLGWGNGSGQARNVPVQAGLIALKAGIRHVDTAQNYLNEGAVGETVANSGLSKDEIFVTSKLSGRKSDPSVDGYTVPVNEVRSAVQESIKKLGFIPDLFLIHSPHVAARADLKKTWQVLEEMKDAGELKEIGVSNFRPQDLEVVLDGAKYQPAVNQIEYHPYTLAHLEPVLAIQAKHGILTESFGPLTPLLRHPTGGPVKPVLTKIAKRVTESNPSLPIPVDEVVVLLLWTRAMGVVAVTASGNEERIKLLAEISYLPENILTKEEVQEITSVGKTVHFRHYREHMEKDFALPDLPDGTT
ncbi:conjugated polyketone reductase C1 [Lentinula edodes]|uniref:Conjugated polyketone reductase C1 n=1 Tax=Lentinula edodes TaxID=5353 RepID=A0A1Q3E0C0_LENED|nr:conjugated polyketone reductase C1 [Lentinula edodes]